MQLEAHYRLEAATKEALLEELQNGGTDTLMLFAHWKSRGRITPLEAREPAEVLVCGNPLASGFNGDRREIRIWDEIAFYTRIATKSGEDIPMPLSWSNVHTVRRVAYFITELQRVGK
jgi:hypothetical protein